MISPLVGEVFFLTYFNEVGKTSAESTSSGAVSFVLQHELFSEVPYKHLLCSYREGR